MHTLTLRLLPYILAAAMGLILFVLVEIFVDQEGLSTLLIGVASGFLSVPFMFIFYEIIKDVCTRKLNRELAEHLRSDVNHAVIDLLSAMRRLSDWGDLTPANIASHVKMAQTGGVTGFKADVALADLFLHVKCAIGDTLRGGRNVEVLPADEVRIALDIARHAGVMGSALTHMATPEGAGALAETMPLLAGLVGEWLELQDDELTLHHAFRYVNHA